MAKDQCFTVQTAFSIVGRSPNVATSIGLAVLAQAKLKVPVWVFDLQGERIFRTESSTVHQHVVEPAAIGALKIATKKDSLTGRWLKADAVAESDGQEVDT